MDWEHHYFRYWSPSVNFCHDDIYAVAPVKGTIITLTTSALTICNGKTCRVDDLLYSASCNMSNVYVITQSNS